MSRKKVIVEEPYSSAGIMPQAPLPCPFCGSKVAEKTMKGIGFWIACLNNKCVSVGPLAKNAREARDRWNAAKR